MKIVRVKTGAEVIVIRAEGIAFIDPELSYRKAVNRLWNAMPGELPSDIHRWALSASPAFPPEPSRLSRALQRGRRKVASLMAAMIAGVVALCVAFFSPTAALAADPFQNATYRELTTGWTCVTGPSGSTQACLMDDDKTAVHVSAYTYKDRIDYVTLGFYADDRPNEVQESAMSVWLSDDAQEEQGDSGPRATDLVGAHQIEGDGWSAWSSDRQVLAMAAAKLAA
ncbi:hypothetical protein [Actinoplanes sp. NPDC026670]|uniref:hypothetical protein n=1 Tax=Actinoplanes sp. NPDC026670 TaxID=3154700 RepID=UPI0033C50623